MAEAVILIGVQGSGKTTWFQQNLAATHVHVSRDLQGVKEPALIAECLHTGTSFAVDDTNGSRAVRATLVANAKKAGFRVVAVHLNTPTRTAIGRNNHRKDKKPIPVPAILKAAKHLQPPAEDEGFDEIRIIDSAPPAP